MWERKKTPVLFVTAFVMGWSGFSHAATSFFDDFSVGTAYSAAAPHGNYTASDEDSVGTWTASGGTLSYSRVSQNPPAINPIFFYSSSVLLTNGSTASTGNTAGLTQFTVNAQIDDIPAANNAQPGVIVSGSLAAGGYLITDFTGENNDFVLLAETGGELVGDEGGTAAIVRDFGAISGPALMGHDYSFSATEDRSGATAAFSVIIMDLGLDGATTPPDPSLYFSGSFKDRTHPSNFGGTEIGYRVRDAHDQQTSTFGSLSLSVPEPGFLSLIFPAIVLAGRSTRRPKQTDRIIWK